MYQCEYHLRWKVEANDEREYRIAGRISSQCGIFSRHKLNYFESFSGSIFTGQTQTLSVTATAHGWEIPVILKWHVRPARNGLFVGGGFAARNSAGSRLVIGTDSCGGLPTTNLDYIDKQAFRPNPWTFGGIATLGVDIQLPLESV